jgi:hypothetical protein
LLWDGEIRGGLHRVRDSLLKAPDDLVEITLQFRNVRRGEVDICINFRFDGELPPPLIEALRATAYAIMSLLNLQLGDYLTPAAPFQLTKWRPDGRGELAKSAIPLGVHNRQSLEKETLRQTILSIANVLLDSVYGERLRLALELYAAHFSEHQVRVRFLLLVIAMESLAKPTTKHQTMFRSQSGPQQLCAVQKPNSRRDRAYSISSAISIRLEIAPNFYGPSTFGSSTRSFPRTYGRRRQDIAPSREAVGAY